jgi:SAM-dependent methyltransferase
MRIRNENTNTKDLWNIHHSNGHNTGITAQFTRFFEEGFVPSDKAISLLDIGCGEMLYVRDYNQQNLHPLVQWHGLDLSETVAEKNRAFGHNITAHALNVMSEPMPGVFDFIVSMHSFEHFDDPVFVLNRCIESAREKVIICVPYEDAWGNDPTHIHKFTLQDPFTGYESFKILNDNKEIFFVFDGRAKP